MSRLSPICAWLIRVGIFRSPSEFRRGTVGFEGVGLGTWAVRPNEANCCGEDRPLGDGRPGAIGLERGEKAVGTLLERTIDDSKASPKLTRADFEVWFPVIGRGGDAEAAVLSVAKEVMRDRRLARFAGACLPEEVAWK